MKKKISKKLTFDKCTVSNLTSDSMQKVMAGIIPTRLESYCPAFTCGQQECAATRLVPLAYC